MTLEKSNLLNDRKAYAEDIKVKILVGQALLGEINKTTDEKTKIFLHSMLRQNMSDQDFKYLSSKIDVFAKNKESL